MIQIIIYAIFISSIVFVIMDEAQSIRNKYERWYREKHGIPQCEDCYWHNHGGGRYIECDMCHHGDKLITLTSMTRKHK